MHLVQLCHKLLNERSVKVDVADVLFVSFWLLDYLRLQQQKFIVSHLELEVLAHQVAQISAHTDLHRKRHGRDRVVIHDQMLLYEGVFVLLLPPLALICDFLLNLPVDQLPEVLEKIDSRHLDVGVVGLQLEVIDGLLCLLLAAISHEHRHDVAHDVHDAQGG